MAYGLVNAPLFFQAFINDVFRDMLNRFVVVYLEHVRHVRLVLSLAYGLYVKVEKCKFHKKELSFLGYRIGPSGVNMEESKVTAMTMWPEPITVKELQRFLGFTDIQGFHEPCRF